jgi:tetratricopeptide (TPR) repeat protein
MWAWLAPEAVARAGRWQEARSLAAETLEISLQANFPYSILTSRFALGLAFAGQSAWSEALAEFEHGLEIARMLDHPWDIATFLYEMGSVYAIRANSGDREKARRSFDEALAYFTELKAQPSVDKVIAALDR